MTREAVISAAARRIGPYVKGSSEVQALCRYVCDPRWTDAQCKAYDRKDWCGLFALACLRDAGVTTTHWTDGVGFIGPLRLKKVPWPKPGDIAFKAAPFQHHMVVEWYNHEKDWGDIAGNTPTAARHRHTSSDGVTFYSIASLLGEHDTDPAPPPGHQTLRVGSTGPEVMIVQRAVGAKPDGVYGPATAKAVAEFQRRRGLGADGICGALTWKEIDET